MRTKWRARVADRRTLDAVAVLGCLFLTVLAVKAAWSGLPRPVIAVSGTVGSLLMWWRRSLPIPASLGGALAFVLSGNPGPWLVGVYSGASYAPRRQVWLVALVGWAGAWGMAGLPAGQLTASDGVYAAGVVALLVAVGLYTSAQRALTASWRDQVDQAVAERRLRDEQARAAERTRIAREMHDVLAHKVSLIAVHAGALELGLAGTSPRWEQSAGLIRTTAREALQDLRYVLGILRESTVDSALAEVGELVRVATEAGQRVELVDRAGPLPPATARVVHRIVQEGLTNARKHAPGAAVSVVLDRGDDGTVTARLDNSFVDAAPMDLPSAGTGLIGLAERVRLVGGTLSSGPHGDGWRLSAVVPWLDLASEESM